MSKICDTSFLFCVVLSRPYFTESKSLFFFHFGHLLNIIVSVPRTPITVPLWTIFASKCPCFFLCKGARLASDRHSGGSSEPSVCSTGGDSASVLGEGGGEGDFIVSQPNFQMATMSVHLVSFFVIQAKVQFSGSN